MFTKLFKKKERKKTVSMPRVSDAQAKNKNSKK